MRVETIKKIKDIIEDTALTETLQKIDLNDTHIYISLIDECTLINTLILLSSKSTDKMFVVSYDEFYGRWFAIWDKVKIEDDCTNWDEHDDASQDIDYILNQLNDDEIDLIYKNLNRKIIDGI